MFEDEAAEREQERIQLKREVVELRAGLASRSETAAGAGANVETGRNREVPQEELACVSEASFEGETRGGDGSRSGSPWRGGTPPGAGYATGEAPHPTPPPTRARARRRSTIYRRPDDHTVVRIPRRTVPAGEVAAVPAKQMLTATVPSFAPLSTCTNSIASRRRSTVVVVAGLRNHRASMVEGAPLAMMPTLHESATAAPDYQSDCWESFGEGRESEEDMLTPRSDSSEGDDMAMELKTQELPCTSRQSIAARHRRSSGPPPAVLLCTPDGIPIEVMSEHDAWEDPFSHF